MRMLNSYRLLLLYLYLDPCSSGFPCIYSSITNSKPSCCLWLCHVEFPYACRQSDLMIDFEPHLVIEHRLCTKSMPGLLIFLFPKAGSKRQAIPYAHLVETRSPPEALRCRANIAQESTSISPSSYTISSSRHTLLHIFPHPADSGGLATLS